jgi:multidrug transporter EmrE-like cation transporter
MSAKASADSSSKRPPRCRSSFIYCFFGKPAGGTKNGMPRESCSILTGVCVGVGTITFFVLFQRGGPLSAVPVILAVGAAMTAIAGILFFREPAFWQRLAGIIWQ